MAATFIGRTAAIICLLGLGLFATGMWLEDQDEFRQLADHMSMLDTVLAMAYTMVAVGVVIILVAILGWVAQEWESRLMLAGFVAALCVIIVSLLGVGVWAITAKSSLKALSTSILTKAVHNYDSDRRSQERLDFIQRQMDCCGATKGVNDFVNNSRIPDSCDSDFYDKPCQVPLYQWIEGKMDLVGTLCLVIDALMVIGILVAFLMDRNADDEFVTCNKMGNRCAKLTLACFT